ncbi:Hypothetical predicted protein [Olea europaea subsp. europaea]|uniref:Uncharacterized protein n=1 Tax=Olea europaea subsp. europaea TaxID=158383 RepID=A0A8S0RGK1_OLEEU|nr:Hypothetical predicted protein [Olea europaea subsp. europaea]
MVSEHYPGDNIWDNTSNEENELEDWVSNLELKIEKMNSEIREGIGAMKFEFYRSLAIMIERLDLMMKKWDVQEREKKDKRVSSTSPEPTLQSDAPLKGLEVGRSIEERLHREGIARLENRGHQLEILGSKDWENSLLDHLPPSQVGTSLGKALVLMQEGTATNRQWNFNVLATLLSVFSEAIKRKRLKPQNLDQNMELAQWVHDSSKSLKKVQAISGPYRYKNNVYSPIIPNHSSPNLNLNSRALAHELPRLHP